VLRNLGFIQAFSELFGSTSMLLPYGKVFSKSTVVYIRKLYLAFQKGETLSNLLTWSHYVEILRKDDPLEISFYVKQCEIEGWSVRELSNMLLVALKTNCLLLATNYICPTGKNCKHNSTIC